ncbi:MAG: adenylosuccinate lyase [Bacteroidetes bacterium]|nr:adenylosuccinate lyase [Bacteroidota bacterium]MBL6943883.1 adenylosuccinate lyase [Bacteroidales bacterium]
MELSSITAVSPIDGRYRNKTNELSEYFSEYALFKYRLLTEIEYFIALCEIPLPGLEDFDNNQFDRLRNIYRKFSPADAIAIKQIEKTTNHDVKAVEYFVKECIDEIGLGEYTEFIHLGLTSQDINNTAIPLSLKDAHTNIIVPAIDELLEKINLRAFEWKNISMLARTHGQPASPTKLGKEIYVFVERIENQLMMLSAIPFSGKFGGATGNMNAHKVAYPEIDWENFACEFVNEALGIHRQKTTTQIEHYDYLAAYFQNLSRINTILIDFSRDIWSYISMDYFKQKIVEGEVGSSAMPHKVNPIDFENAEGNLGLANALLHHLAEKLPVSRLQRDLTDSTVTRNIGTPIGHMLIALKSLIKGIEKLVLNEKQLADDLDNNWAVIAEAIQTILRRENYPQPYEELKKLTRTNEKITRSSIHYFIDELEISDDVKRELKLLTPHNYTGIRLI